MHRLWMETDGKRQMISEVGFQNALRSVWERLPPIYPGQSWKNEHSLRLGIEKQRSANEGVNLRSFGLYNSGRYNNRRAPLLCEFSCFRHHEPFFMIPVYGSTYSVFPNTDIIQNYTVSL